MTADFTTPTFLGAVARSVNTSIGLGGQASQLTVSLVEDLDSLPPKVYAPPALGTPVSFQFYGFGFKGLLQKSAKKNETSGLPTYEAVVVDPREILEGTTVILGGYYGTVGPVRNLINAFGYWENRSGFGGSLANESGMPWHRVRDAILALTSLSALGAYGGPLEFRGVKYKLDLSQLPTPPAYYRVGGTSAGLLDLISQVCEDGGHDYFIELVYNPERLQDGYTIRVRTIGRTSAPPLGTITAITNTNWGNAVVRSSAGTEIRNEVTSSFLVGGEQTALHLTNAVVPFWGYDLYGNVIANYGSTIPGITYLSGAASGVAIPWDTADLNASEISDVIGSTRYTCTTLEMRLALASFEAWSTFVAKFKPGLATSIGLIPTFNGPAAALTKTETVRDEAAKAQTLSRVNSPQPIRDNRVYEFVRKTAAEYMGKKFLVGIPFVLSKRDPETLRFHYSQEPTDAGYLPEGSSPLGLSPLNEDAFKAQDGRFGPFVRFSDIRASGLALDLTRLNPGDWVWENGNFYLRAQVDQRIVFTPNPAVVMTLSSAVQDYPTDAYGGYELVALALQGKPEELEKLTRRGGFGTLGGIRVAPPCRRPEQVAVPLKSNILTYGPWYVAGAAGKVRFEQDSSLVPWNYGGFTYMNLAANAKVSAAATNAQVVEEGQIELAGAPAYSLGDVMRTGGPNITNIDIQMSIQGVTTTYRFSSFTPKFGVFSKGQAERVRKVGRVTQELRRNLRASARNNFQVAAVESVATLKFLEHASKPVKRESPHDVLVSTSVWDSANNSVRVGVSTATYEEAVGLANADSNTDFKSTSVMSLTGLVRPFSTAANDNKISVYETSADGSLSAATYNPFQASNDVEVHTWGNTYSGLHAYRRGADVSNARLMALRGPAVMTGWGYNIHGSPVPEGSPGSFLANYLRRSDQWKTGPMDPYWDEFRKTWTSHDVLVGSLVGDLPGNGSGMLQIKGYSHTVAVQNHFSRAASGNTIALFHPYDKKWYALPHDWRLSVSSPLLTNRDHLSFLPTGCWDIADGGGGTANIRRLLRVQADGGSGYDNIKKINFKPGNTWEVIQPAEGDVDVKRILDVYEGGSLRSSDTHRFTFDSTDFDVAGGGGAATINTSGLTDTKYAYHYTCSGTSLIQSVATVVFTRGLCKSWSAYV